MSVKPFNTPIAMDSVHTAVPHQHSHAPDDDSDPSVPRHAREKVPDTIHNNLLWVRNDVFAHVVSLFWKILRAPNATRQYQIIAAPTRVDVDYWAEKSGDMYLTP